jgi:hypothetical protein
MSQNNSSSVASPLASTTPNPKSLDDKDLADWLNDCFKHKRLVGYVHAGFVCKVVDCDDPSLILFPADPERKSKTALKKLTRSNRLQRLELPQTVLTTASVADPSWTLVPVVSVDEIVDLIDARQEMLGRVSGRGPAITAKAAQKVWADAGGRCMFTGCAEDLSNITLYSQPARIGYLAHIVASDPQGPRGCQQRSHLLSDNPDNIMLMCDAHHRLIDSFAPDVYDEPTLVEMRQTHRNMVRGYMDSMRFPRSKAITLHANLANVPTCFHESEFIEAILGTYRAMLPGVAHYVRRTTQRDDRNTPGFWPNYLREHENQIRELVTRFNNPNEFDMDELAVFPLHHNATMVLAGRLMGEARAIQVFQYQRDRRTWAWDKNVIPKPAGTFIVNGLCNDRSDEALVTLELTARMDEQAMPIELAPKVADGKMPWIRISTPIPSFDCIAHQNDLDQFTQVARRVINHIQDVMRVRQVNLIAISPASTVFRFGQMLQAGHHPLYTIYDRAGRDDKFVPAFSISGHEVNTSDGSQSYIIAIR